MRRQGRDVDDVTSLLRRSENRQENLLVDSIVDGGGGGLRGDVQADDAEGCGAELLV